MARVLVTDGEQRAALAVVRSLARAGHEVFVCSHGARSLAGASRHCSGYSRSPDPLTQAATFAAAVRQIASQRRIEVLLPITEAALLALLPQRAAFAEICLPFVERDTFERVCDKSAVLARARELGIATPEQYVLHGPATLLNARYPVVIKPARSVIGENGSRAKTAAAHADDAKAFSQILSAIPSSSYPVLVQERITGAGMGVFVLMWDGELIANFAHRRIREKPPWGGVSVCCTSCEVDAALLDASVRLLRALDWQGVAMVEYKLDAATGKPYLMEINGRFWGSLQLAIDAGVDFPALLVDTALGTKPRATAAPYRIGVRSRWWWGDVDHLLTRMKHSKQQLGLPDYAPSRTRAVIEFVRSSGDGTRAEVFRWSDPAPAFIESLSWLREMVRSSSRSLSRRMS